MAETKKTKTTAEKTQKSAQPSTENKTVQKDVHMLIVRVRAAVRMSGKDEYALKSIGLDRPNSCTILKLTPSVKGTIDRIHGFITWGEADENSITLLKKIDAKATAFCLSPPKSGYGRKGIKLPFTKGGALGYRGAEINDLIKRMTA